MLVFGMLWVEEVDVKRISESAHGFIESDTVLR
jgi:hypothetical protein